MSRLPAFLLLLDGGTPDRVLLPTELFERSCFEF